ncbi:MAG: hypothetical protein KDA93_13505 [Planctomycetaceae bacterium]|nr:hypothetical protein [Planctomycetaceae bacterium]
MKNIDVVRHKQRLDATFDKAKELNGDPELLAHWARYLCVLASGFIEASVRTIVAEYATKRASPEIAHFIGKSLKSFSNAKMSKIYEVASQFGNDFGDKLIQSMDEEYEAAVDSIVSNRHQIAHGRNVGIGLVTIQQYYKSAVKAVEVIEQQFDES